MNSPGESGSAKARYRARDCRYEADFFFLFFSFSLAHGHPLNLPLPSCRECVHAGYIVRSEGHRLSRRWPDAISWHLKRPLIWLRHELFIAFKMMLHAYAGAYLALVIRISRRYKSGPIVRCAFSRSARRASERQRERREFWRFFLPRFPYYLGNILSCHS